MLKNSLQFEDGFLNLGNIRLPGLFKNQSISSAVRFDEAEQDGVSGKVKNPLGWDDSDITFVTELLTDEHSDCYTKLKALNSIFRGFDNGGNPKIFDISNKHVNARGINQVVFSKLESRESDDDDIIIASLTFIEDKPAIVKVEQQVIASDSAKTGTPSVNASGTESTDSEIDKDPDVPEENSFLAGYNAGAGQ